MIARWIAAVSAVSAYVLMPGAGSFAAAETPEQVVDYWVGDLKFSGTMKKDGGLNLNGNTLSFNLGQSEPLNGEARIKVWLAADGVPRLQINDCVSALFPEQPGTTLETGGLFVPDLAYAGSPTRCGLNEGEVVVKQTNRLTPQPDGLVFSYTGENTIQYPYKGRAELTGSVLLRPVYKQVRQPAQGASAAANSAGPLSELATIIDKVITADSSGWLFNQYDRGSVTNERFLEKSEDGQNGVVYAEYAFNGGSQGWIKIVMKDSYVDCMEYWDAAGRCRPFGTASYGSQLAVGMMVAAITAPPSSGDSSNQQCSEFIVGHEPGGRPISMGQDCR
jgi:hypothetical protein